MKKSKLITLLIFLLVIPITLFLGTKIPGRGYYITGTLIIIEMLIPFFLAFEGRKVQARELVLLAVMCALAIVGRVAIPLPHFKAIFAILLITGIAFGPESGFMTGAIAALASNFFYGQGPYTPWQMMAYGAVGLLAGFFFRGSRKQIPMMAVYPVSIFNIKENIIGWAPDKDLYPHTALPINNTAEDIYKSCIELIEQK